MKATISDVARLAGVSITTVSHAINNTRYVSPETKQKVYNAISVLNYTPDASAQRFRTGKKKTIGFVVPDISSKFFGIMLESSEKILSSNGYHLIVTNTKEDINREETAIRLLTSGLVDGLLVASTMDVFERFDALIPSGFPVVLVDRTFEQSKYTSICVSNFHAIYQSVHRLYNRGAKRIGIIGGLPRLSTTKERISAYRAALKDCKLPVDDTIIHYIVSGKTDMQQCLDALFEQNCDAIIVCRTSLASDALVYAHRRSIRIPEDIKLVAFVDYGTSMNQLYANQLDCIIQPVEELGAFAAEQILYSIKDSGLSPLKKVLSSSYRSSFFAE